LGAKLANVAATLKAVRWRKEEPGFYDVVVHGNSIVLTNALAGDDGGFRKGDVTNHMGLLFQRGTSFPSHEQTEVGRWDHRDMCEGKFDFPLADDMYYAW
jgi:hypothetical protein